MVATLIVAMWLGGAIYVASSELTRSPVMGGVVLVSFILGMLLVVGSGDYSRDLNSRQKGIVRPLAGGLTIGFVGFLLAHYYVGGAFALAAIISITLGALTLGVIKFGLRAPRLGNG